MRTVLRKGRDGNDSDEFFKVRNKLCCRQLAQVRTEQMAKSSQDLFYDLILALPVRRVNCCVDNPGYVVRSCNGFDDLHQLFEYYDDAIFAIARRIEESFLPFC